MAHGDYKCCAICDGKQEYVGLNDSFKDDICPDCRVETGLATVDDLMLKINSFTKKAPLKRWLKEIGLDECYYQNPVDDLITYKLTGKVPEKFSSPGEWLGALGIQPFVPKPEKKGEGNAAE